MRTVLLELLRPASPSLALLDEGARGDDGVDLGGLAGGEDVGRAAVKLIIAGTRPADISAEQRHHGAVRVRQHDADGAAFERERHQLAAEHRGAEQQPLVGERAGDRVLDRDAAPCRVSSAASITASNTVRSVEVVRNTRSDMIS